MLWRPDKDRLLSRRERCFREARWAGSFLLLVFCLSGQGEFLATSAQKLSLEQLVRQADLIVKARVQEISAQQPPDPSTLATVVALDVEEQWKGPKTSQVTLKQPGGSAGEITQRVMGLPEFSVGEEVILFLKKQPDGRYATVGGKQGKFTIKTDPRSGKEMVEDLAARKQELREFLSRLKEALNR
jgi:hypothetical protein